MENDTHMHPSEVDIIKQKEFMQIAIEQALIGRGNGDRPVGSIIVKKGEIIAKGHNRENSDQDTTAHAEMDAIRRVDPSLGPNGLSGSTLYSTGEPCILCAGAIVLSKISCVVLGSNYNPNWGEFGDYNLRKAFDLIFRPKIQIVRGILVEECQAMSWSWRAEQIRNK
jgi:tRNA(adenine34) deaminase